MKTKNILKDILGKILRDLENKSKVLRKIFLLNVDKKCRCSVEHHSFNIFS